MFVIRVEYGLQPLQCISSSAICSQLACWQGSASSNCQPASENIFSACFCNHLAADTTGLIVDSSRWVIGRRHPTLQEKRHAELQMTCFSCSQVIPRHGIYQLASAAIRQLRSAAICKLSCNKLAHMQFVSSAAHCQLSCKLSAQPHPVSSDKFVISAQHVA